MHSWKQAWPVDLAEANVGALHIGGEMLRKCSGCYSEVWFAANDVYREELGLTAKTAQVQSLALSVKGAQVYVQVT